MNFKYFPTISLVIFGLTCLGTEQILAQSGETYKLSIATDQTYQTVIGFGASLAYYENWLNAHPNKSEIYQAIFGELSLDILRVRNAYYYDPGMVERVAEYMVAAESALGHPISLLSTSWGPPGYLKNTGDRKNGGSLRYSIGPDGVEFDYAGFAQWWNGSLDEYSAHGIFPTYISIQNEPDFSASWESCLFNPLETISSSDTIAGYDKALNEVYDTLMQRVQKPAVLGPETVGIGYNSVENYVNALDLTKLDGIAHHLYHGVDENNPYASKDFSKVGDFHPEVPHFQTEYSRGDWFSLAGLIYKSFLDEQVVAYLYWDLIWNEGGLVQLDFPWDQSQWIDPQKGYTKTKEFYAFKQFSAFIHPGWKMTHHSLTGSHGAALTFISLTGDSATTVLINRSDTDDLTVHMDIPGYRIEESAVYSTSELENCELKGEVVDSLVTLIPHSITTLDMRIKAYDPPDDTEAPILEATDSIYQEGMIEVVSSEAGVVYLVPENTSKDLASIREVLMDSVEVVARTAANILIAGLDNGVYWLYASDSAQNISEPEAVRVLGVGIESSIIHRVEFYPNPISQSATLKFSMKKGQNIWLTLMDSQGRVVRREPLGHLNIGEHEIIFHRDGLTEGLYFFRLESRDREWLSGTLMIGD